MSNKPLKIAVVVGHHTYEVQPFQEMFEEFDDMHCYIQHYEQFVSSPKEVRDSYDVVVLYTMWLDEPTNEGPWYEGKARDAIMGLGDTKQGIFVLHHSTLAFKGWDVWTELTGLDSKRYRDYYLDVPMNYHVTRPDHPIMKDVDLDFSMIDEAYDADTVEGIPGIEVLLKTDYDKNIESVAWIKDYKNAKVFCFQSGHDNQTYANPNFRKILHNGIVWLAETSK